MKLPTRKTKDYEARIQRLDQKALDLEQRKKLLDKKKELGLKKEFKPPSWSKIMMALIIGWCVEVLIYAQWVMYVRDDLSALYALIGVPAAMFGTFWAYSTTKVQENSAGGIVYEMAMRKAQQETNDEPVG